MSDITCLPGESLAHRSRREMPSPASANRHHSIVIGEIVIAVCGRLADCVVLLTPGENPSLTHSSSTRRRLPVPPSQPGRAHHSPDGSSSSFPPDGGTAADNNEWHVLGRNMLSLTDHRSE
ncbi:unnamed protein product [Heligmosomoides polygyrus]|uniref:Uncharacterized protein n=1 Tax=Heligmosomoides polygyrus TaxID=6339 RepID=A0A183G1D1_HELPZ|nr:unnamed protein product [Heligmosomoides polygyrus]